MSGAPAILAPGRRRIDDLPTVAAVFATATALALLAIALGWRGSDLPAQIFRADLVRRDGFVLWNSQWFGGHEVLGYSVIAPAVSAFTGPLAVGAISGVVSALLFERILHFAFGRAAWMGALWFALGTVTNLIVGRITFGLGVALGLAAVFALQRRRPFFAAAFGALCALSSPLAGCFLVLVTMAVAVAQPTRRRASIAAGIGALAPLAATTILFPSRGVEPYEPWALVWDLVLCAVVAAALWRYPVVRVAAALFATAIVGSYVIATPVGGNVSRLGQYVAGPLLACALLPRRRLLLAALAIPLLVWQWFPAVDGIAFAHTDPSTRASYYTPLVTYLESQHVPIGRVEIPFTYRHWESAYVAPHVLLARGWERQLDIAYNDLFYDDQLTETSYRAWLHDNGVAFVALPDAQLDDSSHTERDLLLRGLPYLHEVWRDAHWRVWRVNDFHGLVDGPATLTAMSPDRITLNVEHPSDVVLRVRATRRWKVTGGGCATSTSDGWTRLRDLPAGTVTLTQSLAGTRCPGS